MSVAKRNIEFAVLYLDFVGVIWASRCLREDGKYDCCSGFKWNETTNDCDIRCLPGYFGINCTQHCDAGRYGVGCAKCTECVDALCHVSYGCPVATTEFQGQREIIPNIDYQNENTEDRDRKSTTNEQKTRENVWLVVTAGLSIATFVIVLMYIIKNSCSKTSPISYTSQEKKSQWPTVVEGPNINEQNYQGLHDNVVFNGMAKIVINMNTVEKTFSVFLKTEKKDDIDLSFCNDATEPKRVPCMHNFGNEKLYEHYNN